MMEHQIEDNHQVAEEPANEEEKAKDGAEQDKTEMPNEPEAKRQRLEENSEATIMMKDNSNEAEDEEKRTNEEGDGQVVPINDGKEQVQMSIWEWDALLKCITRIEMAERVSLVCRCIKELCWPRMHGNKVRPHMVNHLHFGEGRGENGQPRARLRIERESPYSGIYEEIPIAIAPLPDYIQGFKLIDIWYLDAEVLEFIRKIHPLLAEVNIFIGETCTLDDLQNLFGALNGRSIHYLRITSTSLSILELRQQFPGLLENIPMISVHLEHTKDWLEMNELVWAKHDSGKPFFLIIRGPSCDKICSILIDNIKKTFQAAVQPLSFMIMITMNALPLDEFQLENEATGEVLTLEGMGDSIYQLYRCPRGEVQQWREDAMSKFAANANGTDIYFLP